MKTLVFDQSDSRNLVSDEVVRQKKLRIAHLQLLPLLSGCQQVSLDVLRKLDRNRFEPCVICQSEGPLTTAAEREGIACFYADKLVRPISLYRDFRALVQLTELMRRHQFDIVHTHSSKTGVLGRVAARMAGVPCVIHTVHGFAFPAARSWPKKAFYMALEWLSARFCDMTVCLKLSDVRLAQKWLRIQPEKLRLIPNGVAIETYRPMAKASRERIRQNVFVLEPGTMAIGSVGRLSPQKDPLCFVEAADILLSRGIRAQFFLIGDGELRPDVEAEIRRRGLTRKIRILGWRTDVPQLVGALDLFVLTSRWEGLSLALLEALACGTPVVASDIPGNRDAVVEGVDGLLATCGDAASFAEQMQKLLSHPGLRREYGKAACSKIRKNHRLDDRVTEVENVYSSLVWDLVPQPVTTVPVSDEDANGSFSTTEHVPSFASSVED